VAPRCVTWSGNGQHHGKGAQSGWCSLAPAGPLCPWVVAQAGDFFWPRNSWYGSQAGQDRVLGWQKRVHSDRHTVVPVFKCVASEKREEGLPTAAEPQLLTALCSPFRVKSGSQTATGVSSATPLPATGPELGVMQSPGFLLQPEGSLQGGAVDFFALWSLSPFRKCEIVWGKQDLPPLAS
jgi:hypothetical protein